MTLDSEEAKNELVAHFASCLDQPVILAIAGDYDLSDPYQLSAAHSALSFLSINSLQEEVTRLEAGGSGGYDLPDSEATESDVKSNDGLAANNGTLSAHDALSHPSSSTSEYEPPDISDLNVSHDISTRSSSPNSECEVPDVTHVTAFDDLTNEEKVNKLAAMFVSLKPIDVRLALQRAKGDADSAMDALLSHELLEQTGDRPKGVDGFYKSDDDAPLSKKQGRKKRKKGSKAAASKSADTANASEELPHDGVDDADNIKFLSDSFTLPFDEAADVYQRNKCSLGAAITATLESYLAIELPPFTNPNKQYFIEEQQKRVPWIPHDYFDPIFDITVSPRAAVEVIDTLADYLKKPAYMKYNVPYSAAASGLVLESEHILTDPKSSGKNSAASTSKSSSRQQLRATPTSLQELGVTKAALAASANHSFASASSAYRKGRSDPLWRQAAGVFAERGRTQAASRRQTASLEASLLVDQQSTGEKIDLHGVSVLDGVDIAIERVWIWWNSLGDNKAHKARTNSLEIVTGYGRHSRDGISPLRSRVFKALVADGWKIEILTGSCLVTGRA